MGPRLHVSPLLNEIELVRVRLRLVEPFVTSHGTEQTRDVVLVHVVGDGRDGWGECSTLSEPTYTDECTEEAWSYLAEVAPSVLTQRGTFVEPDPTHPMAWCALEVALADLGVVSPFLVAGKKEPARSSVRSTLVLGRQPSVDELVDRVSSGVDEGYESVKLKIGPGWDVEPLLAVREVHPLLMVAADANGSYDEVGADGLVDLDLERFGLAYLEQPFAAGNLLAHAEARRRLAVPIALDESVPSLDGLLGAIGDGAVDVVNIKPARLGGLEVAHRLAGRAVDEGLRVFVGGMLETGVGRSAALRLAAQPLFGLPTDLGPSARYFADDITDPIGWAAPGAIAVPTGDQLTLRPRPDRLEDAAVDRVVVTG